MHATREYTIGQSIIRLLLRHCKSHTIISNSVFHTIECVYKGNLFTHSGNLPLRVYPSVLS